MKKNYFDLTKEEIKDYGLKFQKTEGGKKLYKDSKTMFTVLLLAWAFIFITMLVGFAFENINLKTSESIASFVDNFINIIFYVFLVLTVLQVVYQKLCFISWLKNEHKILKW